MNPAAAFALFVAVTFALWLATASFISLPHRRITSTSRRSPLVRLPAVFVVMLLALSVLVRPPGATAVIPPPAMRFASVTVAEPSDPIQPSALVVRIDAERNARIHIVVKGDSLWKIALAHLAKRAGTPTGEEIARLWHAIYQTNRDVIGLDPGLILPGQALTIPGGSRG